MESQRTYAEVGRGTVGGGEDVDEAKGLLRRVLDDHGDHSGAHLCLGRILAEEQGELCCFPLYSNYCYDTRYDKR